MGGPRGSFVEERKNGLEETPEYVRKLAERYPAFKKLLEGEEETLPDHPSDKTGERGEGEMEREEFAQRLKRLLYAPEAPEATEGHSSEETSEGGEITPSSPDTGHLEGGEIEEDAMELKKLLPPEEGKELRILEEKEDLIHQELRQGIRNLLPLSVGIEHLAEEMLTKGEEEVFLEFTSLGMPPYDMRLFGRLEEVTSLPKGYVEVERYWIERPFSYAIILREEETGRLRYHLVEPKLTFEEQRILQEMWEELKNKLPYEVPQAQKEELLVKEMMGIARRMGISDPKTLYRLYYFLRRENLGFRKIDALLKDPMIEDISCDGPEIPIFIYHRRYYNMETNIQFERGELDHFNSLLAERSGKHLSFAEPVVDARLPDGARVQVTFGDEITARGASFSIRKWLGKVFTPVDLIRFHTFSPEMLAYLWLAIENRCSVMVIGGTASGKTSTLNALAFFIPPDAKIISIEDTRELSLYQKNWVPNVTREMLGVKPIDMNELVKIAMRQRPECLIVGEVRGIEAQAMFQAICTGHTAFCTMHAGSVQAAVNRLEGDPINIPRPMLAELDIVCLQLLTNLGSERVRRNLQITEFAGLDPVTEEIRIVDTFHWDPATDTFRKVEESWVLRELRRNLGLTPIQLKKELKNREKVLTWLANQPEITPSEIADVLSQYYYNPERVLRRIGES
ncbi:MAG: secretion system protein [Hadesarchaea archaeon]|nr:MAG: secretion system protein [Hadesarchaea archaeon]